MMIRERTIQTYIMFSHTFGIVTQSYGWDIFVVVTILNFVNYGPSVDITTQLIRNNYVVLFEDK